MQSYYINYQTVVTDLTNKIFGGGDEHNNIVQDLYNLAEKKIDGITWFGLIVLKNDKYDKLITESGEDYHLKLEKGIAFHVSNDDKLKDEYLLKLLETDLLKGMNIKCLLVTPTTMYHYCVKDEELVKINKKIDDDLVDSLTRHDVIEKILKRKVDKNMFDIKKIDK
jgi:hypothetical protein